MKKAMKLSLTVIIGCCLSLAMIPYASAAVESGFLSDFANKLQPGPKGGAKERWLKPGTDFSKYDKVMLDGVVFYFDKDSEDLRVDPEQMKELADTFNKDLVDALKDKYTIVKEPGPGVIRYKIALTGIKQSKPVLSGASSVLPVGLAASVLKKGVGGSWIGSGATSAELIAVDAQTNEVIAVARDDQTAGFTKRFSKYGSAEDAFKFWAQRVREFMDQAHEGKSE